jgi:hypothetical protein
MICEIHSIYDDGQETLAKYPVLKDIGSKLAFNKNEGRFDLTIEISTIDDIEKLISSVGRIIINEDWTVEIYDSLRE